MIEGPEARVIARQLYETVSGKTITEAVANYSPHKFAFFRESQEATEKLLIGRTVQSVQPIGGQVEILFDDEVRFAFSDGANIRYIEPGGKLPQKHQLLIGFDDDSALVFTVQMYAMLWVFKAGTFDHEYYKQGQDGVNVYSETFTEPYFLGLAAGESVQNKSVKALLATEQRIPGLGNGVLQDILLTARINPKKKVSDLNEADKKRLFNAIRDVSADMLRLGGRDTETDIFGKRGGYPVRLSAKALGNPCPVCGGKIERKAYMGGNIYYCTNCQPI